MFNMTMLEKIRQTENEADKIREQAKAEVNKMLVDAKKQNDDFRKTSYNQTLESVSKKHNETEVLLQEMLKEANLKVQQAKDQDNHSFDSHIEEAIMFVRKLVIDS